jgi:hypothetical protein
MGQLLGSEIFRPAIQRIYPDCAEIGPQTSVIGNCPSIRVCQGLIDCSGTMLRKARPFAVTTADIYVKITIQLAPKTLAGKGSNEVSLFLPPTRNEKITTLQVQFSGSDDLPKVSRIDLHFELCTLNAPIRSGDGGHCKYGRSGCISCL